MSSSWNKSLNKKVPERSGAELLLALQTCPLSASHYSWVDKFRTALVEQGRLSRRQIDILEDILRQYR